MVNSFQYRIILQFKYFQYRFYEASLLLFLAENVHKSIINANYLEPFMKLNYEKDIICF